MDDIENMRRLLTGIRPTGPLHLGHYVGALKQWIPLQDEYDCFFLIADVQALTTHFDRPELIERSVREVVLDFLSVGLDPTRPNVNFVLQSAIPELTELTVYLSMVTPFTWMQHNPTIRAELKTLKNDATVGFMSYPVSQAADILFVSKDPATTNNEETILVPVGEDQKPHLRDTNEIARVFSKRYGDVFFGCTPLVGDIGKLVGTDGSDKMGKSLNNAIFLSDPQDVVQRLIMGMYTDPDRVRADIPGKVEGNPVFIYHDAFNPDLEEVQDLKERYLTGRVGDVEVKRKLVKAVNNFLEPIREARAKAETMDIYNIVSNGTTRARELAQSTLARVRSAMHLSYPGHFMK